MSRRPRVRLGPLGAKRPHRAEVARSRIGRLAHQFSAHVYPSRGQMTDWVMIAYVA